jgi:hypothetical protein
MRYYIYKICCKIIENEIIQELIMVLLEDFLK